MYALLSIVDDRLWSCLTCWLLAVQQALLNKYAAKYKQDEKKLYKEKIFDRLEAKNKELEKLEKLRAEATEFDDMPALE